MVFTSITFLVFFLAFLPLYALTAGRTRLWVILIGSAIFYGWWDWRFLALIGSSILLDYSMGRLLARSANSRRRSLLVWMTVVFNLATLGFFKYFNFFYGSSVAALDALGVTGGFKPLEILLPVGLSFYTFQSMAYVIDVYRGHIEAERSLLRYAAFVMFFPQLVAGPIVRAEKLLVQMRQDQPLRWESFVSGMQCVIWGYFLKSAIADSFATIVDKEFAHPEMFSSLSLLLGVVFYAFQIYGDFAGYSLIAIGVARILGFDLGKNFNRPYFSASFSEFWQRWHISLSSWLRDYLYIPLGGNRGSTLFTYRNLMLTMLLGGLWHGANWTFIVWGALHGAYLVAQRVLGGPVYELLRRVHVPQLVVRGLSIGLVFGLTCLAWTFFRAQSCQDALFIIRKIAAFDGMGLKDVAFRFETIKCLMLLTLLIGLETLSLQIPNFQTKLAARPWRLVASGACVVWLLAFFGTFGGSSFIYFQF